MEVCLDLCNHNTTLSPMVRDTGTTKKVVAAYKSIFRCFYLIQQRCRMTSLELKRKKKKKAYANKLLLNLEKLSIRLSHRGNGYDHHLHINYAKGPSGGG
ncbi:hypothetical protein GLYMA_14G150950v4 [Glycine max]|nr:hypothetical protein GLYMA_14G150950v4 [Glycine max]KAH1094578.1 hypothetical protein GYH30_040038 [Glycine max]